MSQTPRRIVLVGLGLIGGSLAAASRKKFPRAKIIGVTRNRSALSQAKKKKWIHEGFQHLDQAFRKQDKIPTLIILCTPVDTLKDFLKRIDRLAPSGTVVTDTGSVKGFLVRWAERQRWQHIQFVGAHPMAGSHERGINAARSDLFKGSLTLITPGRKNSSQPLHLVNNFWKKVSGRVVIVSPEEHDSLTAEMSHLPHLLAALLVDGISSKALNFAASGFLDTTRVAQGDPALWVPIFLENRRELSRAVFDFESKLRQIKKILMKGDIRRLRKILGRAQKRRLVLGNFKQ